MYICIYVCMVLFTDASDQYIGACLTHPCLKGDGSVPGIPEDIPQALPYPSEVASD